MQNDDLFGSKLGCGVSMSKPTILTKTPCVQISIGDDGCTVRAPTSDVSHTFRSQRFYQSRRITVPTEQNSVVT